MKLQTQIPLNPVENQIDYESRLLLLGSCFSENLGGKLAYFKFRTLQNPFGILFQPKAIENLIERAIQKKSYSEADIFFHNERWHCFDAHSDLSDASKEKFLKKLNSSLEETRLQLTKSTHLIITLGTAWVYRNNKTDTIVANCHKVPQKEFSKELLSVDAVIQSLAKIIESVRSVNQNVQFIFTVSPVRHLKDGFIENQRSKAYLIAAIHELIETTHFAPRTSYFFSYELLMDELRDYRFYEADMVHPNSVAIDYIWEKFKKVWISEKAYPTMEKVDAVQKGLSHRPFHANSEQHLSFRKSLETKIKDLQRRHPFMNFEKEGQNT